MTGRVLWYIHDHGHGHLARARAVIPLLTSPVIVAAGPGIAPLARTVLDVPVIALPSDVPTRPARTVGPWHHAPSDVAQRRRALALVSAVERHRCTTAVVDVSMEVTVLARLLGLRVVALRQSGRRGDDAHRTGLATADAVWVPQHRDLEPLDGPTDERWWFTGAFSRFDDRAPLARPIGRRRSVVLLVGAGGTTFDASRWHETTPPAGWTVSVVGAPARWSGDVCSLGRVDDVGAVLGAADVVVTSAGWAAVADAVASGATLVVVPEARPFGEQAIRARTLHEAGLAVSLERWPSPSELGDVIQEADTIERQRWSSFYDRQGAHRAAHLVDEVHAA